MIWWRSSVELIEVGLKSGCYDQLTFTPITSSEKQQNSGFQFSAFMPQDYRSFQFNRTTEG